MSHLIDDENVDEFHGGTLQLNSSQGRAQVYTIGASTPATLVPSSIGGQPSTSSQDAEPSAAGPSSPLVSPTNSGTTGNRHVLPMYHIPFANENPKDYFSYRNGLVQSAIDECNSTLIFPNQDGQVIGSWLMTEISIWDNEKERLVTLTDRALITVKYDFIALKQLDFRKVYLEELDTVAIGDLIYPPSSFIPRLNGLANGVSTVVRDCILDRFTSSTAPATDYKNQSAQSESNKKFGPIDLKSFESSNRNMRGVRAMWNRGQPLSFLKKWNPFDKEIPLNTFSSHPLFWHKDTPEAAKSLYDCEDFGQKLVTAVEAIGEGRESPCRVVHAPIILPNYVGLTSLVHNKNSLGFFKVRGKFSF